MCGSEYGHVNMKKKESNLLVLTVPLWEGDFLTYLYADCCSLSEGLE